MKGIGMRKTFSSEKRAEILAYIEKYDAKKGRGGQSAAAKKFNVSRVTIINWLKGTAAPAAQSTKIKPLAPAPRGKSKPSAQPVLEMLSFLDLLEHSIPKLKKSIEKLAK
jgi:transposase